MRTNCSSSYIVVFTALHGYLVLHIDKGSIKLCLKLSGLNKARALSQLADT